MSLKKYYYAVLLNKKNKVLYCTFDDLKEINYKICKKFKKKTDAQEWLKEQELKIKLAEIKKREKLSFSEWAYQNINSKKWNR